MKEILTIIIKEYPNTVLKMNIVDMDKTKFSKKFQDVMHLDNTKEVYVKCDDDGNISYRGKKQEYRIFSIPKHKIIKSK